MGILKKAAKCLIRTALSCPGTENYPIVAGPLKGWRLPRAIALRHYRMLWGGYEPEMVSTLLSLVKPSTIAYDVGANVGYLTLAFAAAMEDGKIFAFEPLSENQSLLQKLIAANNLGRIVTVIPLALAGREGSQEMYIHRSWDMAVLESALDGQDVTKDRGIRVSTTTLDSFVFAGRNPAPHILKLDVEGAESLVLEGGVRTLKEFSPKIILEIHGPNNAHKIWDILRDFQYRWMNLTPRGRKTISSEGELLSLFSPRAWTPHFLLDRS